MAILGNLETTLADKQAQQKLLIKAQINTAFLQLKSQFTRNFKMVWNNPDLKPQEVFDAFGTDAAQLFLIAGTIQSAMNSIQPNTLTQIPPYAYTIHSDGSVTVGDALPS